MILHKRKASRPGAQGITGNQKRIGKEGGAVCMAKSKQKCTARSMKGTARVMPLLRRTCHARTDASNTLISGFQGNYGFCKVGSTLVFLYFFFYFLCFRPEVRSPYPLFGEMIIASKFYGL